MKRIARTGGIFFILTWISKKFCELKSKRFWYISSITYLVTLQILFSDYRNVSLCVSYNYIYFFIFYFIYITFLFYYYIFFIFLVFFYFFILLFCVL